ncbi:hypothetical protein IscW_ISCW003752 [Ixodes scapularis]|uniref:KHA domain-containing protein n=1 Tax=Ixodes scapularis TaxID=6945 RepID=B7PI02_IXOSC|nr:hypothetical protein IscW_ISCW003752 [Ixodes scapularis]|eukprot:XP_002404046.1 hypothetical protein IscW_ISCW003752 [Ixodes scapularis]
MVKTSISGPYSSPGISCKAIFPVPESLEKLLQAVSAKFGMQAKRLFTDKGGEIDDVALIR